MNKILIFTTDVLPFKGLPASGGSLRSLQVIKGLESHGFDVVYYMQSESTYLLEQFKGKLPPDLKSRSWTFSNQDEIIKREKPDVIVVMRPMHLKWIEQHDIPVAVDLAGPGAIEQETLSGNIDARFIYLPQKLRGIMGGDFFTCAGYRQRYYFMAFFLMAGVALEDLDVHPMPHAMPSDMPPRPVPDPDRKSLVFSGGFYPWFNPIPPLSAAAKALLETRSGYLDFYGSSHQTTDTDARTFNEFRAEMEQNPRVTFHGYVPREDILDIYSRSYAAIELMLRNAERELAFTTRTVEFLWAGLPVIYSDYQELSDLIRDYGAGWVVSPTDSEAVSALIHRIMDNPDEVAEASRNAQRLVSEKLTYEEVIKPLAEFCKNPWRRKRTATRQLTSIEDALAAKDAEIQAMQNSRSWKITAPLRSGFTFFENLRRKLLR